MQTTSKQPAPAPASRESGQVSTHSIWNQDAIRIAEQIRHQLTTRPAVILMGGLENSNDSAAVALETSQAMAVLTGERVLLLDADVQNSGLEELARAALPGMEAPAPLSSVLEHSSPATITATRLQELLFFSYFERQALDGDSSLITPALLAQLEQIRTLFPLTVLHSSAFSSQESYALLARADFIVVVVTKGISGFGSLEQFYLTCQSITDSPLAAVLAKETQPAPS